MAKILPRTKMPEQSPDKRIKNFNEVALGYDEKSAVQEASRCLQCKKPECIKGCPVEIDIPAFLKLIKEKNFQAAIDKLKEKNSLPAICGRVCPQETQCEELCVLGKKQEPVAIGRLERFIADWERAQGIKAPEMPKKLNKKVAVIGAGPAGLTCASDLAKMGYSVTIFESLHKTGGVLRYGIPEFRLPKAVVDAEVDYVKKLGVEIKTDVVVGKSITVDEILQEHDAVFVGTGAGLPQFLNIEGENLSCIYSANEFLTRINLMCAYKFPEYDTPVKVGKRVAVVGAGNVAMDSARCALRMGAEYVWIVYRRSEEEMPARKEEIERAREEGVRFMLLTLPIKFYGNEKDYVKKMECIQMKLGEADESGRRKPVPIEGSNFVMEVDTVVIAIGQSPNPLIPRTTPGLQLGKHGNIIADENGKTSKESVYAGGDIVTGAATVISAMGAGRKAARAIDEFLKAKCT